MKVVFEVLYPLHPALPLVYLALFAAGLLGPAVYLAIRKLPFSIWLIFRDAKDGSKGAQLAAGLFVTLVIATMGVFLLAML